MSALFEGDTALLELFARSLCVSSVLTFAEASRVVARTPGPGALRKTALDQFRQRCDLMAIDDAVLERVAEKFPHEPLRTLDAIHLSTALILRGAQPLVIATIDARLRQNAIALGFEVVPE